MSKRTVDVESTLKEITYLDVENQEHLLGTIEMEAYGKDEVKRFSFEVAIENDWAPDNKRHGGHYLLGTGSSKLDFVNPADAQRPLIDAGFEAVQQYAQRGGLRLHTIYKHPDVFQEDLFPYDESLWDWRRLVGPDVNKSYQGVLVETDLRVGYMAVRYTAGLYRMVCENGLFHQTMSMDSIQIRHLEFDVVQAKEQLQEFIGTPFHYGPVITNIKHLGKARKLLQRYATELFEGELSPQMELLSAQFQGISKNVLSPWAVQGYLDHLTALINYYPEYYEIQTMHLVNAYTSAVNAHRMRQSDRGILSALDAIRPVVQTTASLANISAIFE